MSIRDLFRKHKIPTGTDVLVDLLCLRIAAYPLDEIRNIRGLGDSWLLTFDHNGRSTKLETSVRTDRNLPKTIYNQTYITVTTSLRDGKHKWTEIKLSNDQKIRLSKPLAQLWTMWEARRRLEEEHKNETAAVDVIESLIGIGESKVVDPVDPKTYNENPFVIDPLTINERRRLKHDD